MATYTTNLNLKKPAGTEDVSINDINGNMDTIDTKMGAVGSTSLQAQVTTLSSDIGTLSSLTTTSKTSAVSAINEVNGKFSTIEEKQVLRIGTYFSERTAFKSRRIGNIISIFSYFQVTTQIPANTEFADLQFGNANGNVLVMDGGGNNPRVGIILSGKLKCDEALPTGYYYVMGSIQTIA